MADRRKGIIDYASIILNHALSAQERYVLFREEYPEIEQNVPQYMVASYLGITKEFLSMIKKRSAEEARFS